MDLKNVLNLGVVYGVIVVVAENTKIVLQTPVKT